MLVRLTVAIPVLNKTPRRRTHLPICCFVSIRLPSLIVNCQWLCSFSIRPKCLLSKRPKESLPMLPRKARERSHGLEYFKSLGRQGDHGLSSMERECVALVVRNTWSLLLFKASNEMRGLSDVVGSDLRLFVSTNSRKCTGTACVQKKLSAESSRTPVACFTRSLLNVMTPPSFSWRSFTGSSRRTSLWKSGTLWKVRRCFFLFFFFFACCSCRRGDGSFFFSCVSLSSLVCYFLHLQRIAIHFLQKLIFHCLLFTDLLALVGVDEVTRLKLAGNATYTSLTARNDMLEAIYTVVQVSYVVF